MNVWGEYLANDSKVGHGVDDAQEGRNGFRFFPNLGLVNLELQVVMLKVFLDLISVQIVYVQIGHGQHSAPTLETSGQLGVLGVEDAIEESEVVRNLLITLDVETVLRLEHGGFHVRHIERTGTIREKRKRRGKEKGTGKGKRKMVYDDFGEMKRREKSWGGRFMD